MKNSDVVFLALLGVGAVFAYQYFSRKSVITPNLENNSPGEAIYGGFNPQAWAENWKNYYSNTSDSGYRLL